MTIGTCFGGSTKCFRIAVAVTSALCVGVGLAGRGAAGAVSSSASSVQVLHFFSKSQTMTFSTAAGKRFSPSKAHPPAPGDEIESTDLDYVGTQLHHAARWTASDHLLCTVPAEGHPVCDAQIAMGSSMILLRGLATPATTSTFVVTGGTGQFAGVTGSLVSVNLGDSPNGDLTIRLRRP